MRVVIIGAGIIGAMIAYELSLRQGLIITLIDEKSPASGATGAALGVLMGVISQKTQGRGWLLRKTSLERYATLIPELEALTGKLISVNRQGIVKLGFEEEDWNKWKKLSNIRQKQGYSLEIWDKAQLQKQCPQVDHQVIQGAIYSPSDRQIEPTILTQTLVTAALINGVTCQFGIKVQNLIFNNPTDSVSRCCEQIQTSQGNLKADWVIVAAGLGSTPLVETISLRPVLGQALLLKLPNYLGNKAFQPVITGNDLHIVPVSDHYYWLGATVEFPDQNGEIIENPQLLRELRQKAVTYCPNLADATIIRQWMGKRPRPQGIAAPIIQLLSPESNTILATGHYRNGILLAPATALAVTRMIL